LRAIVQKDPWQAKLLKTPEQEAVAHRPGSGGVARRTREHRGPGRGDDSSVDIPAAESEPPEDRDIHRAKSPTPPPASETFTQAESTPPLPTPSHSATTSPAPTPSIPYDTTNPHPPQQIAAGGSRDARSPNATNTAHAPSSKPHNKPEPPTHTAPRRRRGCRGCHRT